MGEKIISGINMWRNIRYLHSSFRYFEEKEYHVTRYCEDDVLLIVFEGTLRFVEEGVHHEVHAGEYYIQKHCQYQTATLPSDAPKYLYVHFFGEWGEGEGILPKQGRFHIPALYPLLQKMDDVSHGNYTYTRRTAVFLELLSTLYETPTVEGAGKKIASFIEKNYLTVKSLEDICEYLHYSKNHVINLFKREFGMTPFAYLHEVKLKRAMYLLEVTSKSVEEISLESGFPCYSHFYRLFVRRNGLSPVAWRNKVQLTPHIDWR